MPLDDDLSVNKYLPLQKEKKYQEMLDLAISQEGKVSRYWEIVALRSLERYDEGLEKGLSYGEYFKDKWKVLYYKEMGVFVETIDAVKNGTEGKYWQYFVNDKLGEVAADKKTIKESDKIEWRFEVPPAF